MKRLDIIIPHEHLQEVNDILHKHKVGGMTFMISRAEVAQNENQYQLAGV
jgi:nitrogen regulatory protein PII